MLRHNRRLFLHYLAGGMAVSLVLGCNRDREADNNQANGTSEAIATDDAGVPISVKKLLQSGTEGVVLVKGLPKIPLAYLVITSKPSLAEYAVKPICTHKGCTLNWDQAKKHFVCPCHKAEFTADGQVVSGPAKKPLVMMKVIVNNDQVKLLDN